jgi:Flp pilus assembly protein TadB
MEGIILCILLALAILLPVIIIEFDYRKKVKKLSEDFKRESNRINELEKRKKPRV